MPPKSKAFNYTTSERRASTTIVGSLTRSGLFVPQDFINQDPDGVTQTLSEVAGEDMNDEDDEDDDNETTPLYDEEAARPDENPGFGANRSSVGSALGSPLSRIASRRASTQIISDEAKLMELNRVPTRHGSAVSVDEQPTEEDIQMSWDDAVKAGKIATTPSFELKCLAQSSVPLVLTFLLQSSFPVCSVFAVGHLSSEALAGVTLGMMSCNMTAIAVIAGLASSLDTFLPQAYGARKYHLVGLIFQRCAALIFCIMVVICILWWLYSYRILLMILPDKKSANYASVYLKITSFGIPGYILFETGKRFLQAQGIFDASTYVLIVCAPLNAIMNYTFVWKLGFGYEGAPLAVSINYTLMALGLFLYTVTTKNPINPLRCWNGFKPKRIFRNWGELLKLSIPNLIMIVSEFLSFEVLTLMASYLGTSSLAAQSVISTMASLTYQVPYGVSIAASTRLANFLGAELPKAAYTTAQMVFVLTIAVCVLDSSFLYFGRYIIANWFTDDPAVIAIVVHVMPLVAFIQIFDAINATSAGCLRGQGLQKIGGYCNFIGYYIIGIPLGALLAFKYPTGHPLGLLGEWIGVGLALSLIGCVQTYCVLHADFNKLVAEAVRRSNTD